MHLQESSTSEDWAITHKLLGFWSQLFCAILKFSIQIRGNIDVLSADRDFARENPEWDQWFEITAVYRDR